jgi:CBS domain-containing protein
METDVPAVYPDDPVEQVVRTMREHELPGIPVINEGGRCVGIITDADLIMGGEEADLHKHNRLPVVDHGRLVGVVTRIDVLDALTAD